MLRPPRRARELLRRDGLDRDVLPPRQADRLAGELVPRRVAAVREMDDPRDAPVDEGADGGGEVPRVRGAPDLVVDDGELAPAGLHALEDRVHEVRAAGPEDPGRAHDEHLVAFLERAPLAGELAAPVGVDGVHGVVLAVRTDGAPAEDVVRRDVDERRADLAAPGGEEADGDVVDAVVVRVRLGRVHARVGRGVEDESHARLDGGVHGGDVRDVESRAREAFGRRELAPEGAAQHAAGSEDHRLHRRGSVPDESAGPGYLRRGTAKASFDPGAVLPSTTYATPTTEQPARRVVHDDGRVPHVRRDRERVLEAVLLHRRERRHGERARLSEESARSVAHLGLQAARHAGRVHQDEVRPRGRVLAHSREAARLARGESVGRRETRREVDGGPVLARSFRPAGAAVHVRAPTTRRRVDWMRSAPQSSA